MAGSITPVYQGTWAIHHWVFTDSSGAEYRLDVNNGNVWTSKEGFYGSFDANTWYLYFPDGSKWVMWAQSGGNEEDAGTLYPRTSTTRTAISSSCSTRRAMAWGGPTAARG